MGQTVGFKGLVATKHSDKCYGNKESVSDIALANIVRRMVFRHGRKLYPHTKMQTRLGAAPQPLSKRCLGASYSRMSTGSGPP